MKAFILERISQHAKNLSSKIALRFYDSQFQSTYLNYQDLWNRIEAYAAEIEKLNPKNEQTVVLLFQPGIDFVVCFFACLLAEVVPTPCNFPGLKKRSLDRFRSVLKSANSDTVLADSASLKICRQSLAAWNIKQHNVSDWECIAPENKKNTVNSISPDKVAYLQFTSGSTSNAKGTMITFGNIDHNISLMKEFSQCSEDDTVVTWLPHFHDLGLVGQIMLALSEGASLCFMAPQTFLAKPIRWLKAISENAGTISFSPNFGYQHCSDKIPKNELKTLDLSSWKVALNGAEPVYSQTIQEFYNKFSKVGFSEKTFCPAYGLAEATLVVTATKLNEKALIKYFCPKSLENGFAAETIDKEGIPLTSCGQAFGKQKVRIMDPHTSSEKVEGQIGEIWIAGSSVSPGYYKNSKATETCFSEESQNNLQDRFLKTGDLGFIIDSQLFVCGRLKDLIIVRGENFFPQDIELFSTQFNSLFRNSGCCVFATETRQGTELIVLQEIERSSIKEIHVGMKDELQSNLENQFGIPVKEVFFLKPYEILRTSSGKIKRQECRKAYQEGEWTCLIEKKKKKHDSFDTLLSWINKDLPQSYDPYHADKREQLPWELLETLASKGLLAMQLESQKGGLNLSSSEMFEIFKRVSEFDLCLGLLLVLNNNLGARSVLEFSQPDLRERYEKKLAQETCFLSFALTEIAAGSNPNGIKTKAVQVKGGWKLNGHKIYCGSAAWSQGISIFAKTYDIKGRFIGISGFFVEAKSFGLTHGRPAATMGMRGMIQNEFTLNDVFVPDSSVLGELGEGYHLAKSLMNKTRLSIGAMCLGGIQFCLNLIKSYVIDREIITGPMLGNYNVQKQISRIFQSYQSLSTFLESLIQQEDKEGELHPVFYATAKVLAPEILWQIIDQTVQLLGGRAYDEVNGLAKLLRDARVLRIFEGPTETLCYYLGSMVAHDKHSIEAIIKSSNNSKIFNINLDYLSEIGGKDYCKSGQALAWAIFASLVPNQWVQKEYEACTKDADFVDVLSEEQILTELKICKNVPVYPTPHILEKDNNIVIKENFSHAEQVLTHILSWLKCHQNQDAEGKTKLSRLSIDSITAAELSYDLEQSFSVSISPTLFWEVKDLWSLSQRVADSMGNKPQTENVAIHHSQREKLIKNLGLK
ncbi:MAG: AMP-binding protein [Deltaproteobacteria bacterium]|nr:AMP-binding protein [Deltaproteobacteria bacterium]